MTKREFAVLLTLPVAGLALAGGVFFMRAQLETAWNDWDALVQKRTDLSGNLNALAARRTLLLEGLKDVEEEVPAVPEGEVLQAWVQDVLQRNDVELLPSRSGETSLWEGQGSPNSLTLAFHGEYLDVMQVLADWRALPLRIASLTLRRGDSSPGPDGSGGIEAYAILEPLQ